MQYAWSLKNRLADELRAKKILSYQDVERIAKQGGWKTDTATRRLRNEANYLPVIKLNSQKKPIRGSEAWSFVKWDGGKTVFKK